MNVPTLVLVGDQDAPTFTACHFICRHVPNAGMAILPICGHTLNSPELEFFQNACRDLPRGRGRRSVGFMARVMPSASLNRTSE